MFLDLTMRQCGHHVLKRPRWQFLSKRCSNKLAMVGFWIAKNAVASNGGIVIGFNPIFRVVEFWDGLFSLSIKIIRVCDQ